MKTILVTLAIVGFGLEGLATLSITFQSWTETGSLDIHAIDVGYLAGSVAGVFVAIACCLPAKQPKIMPPPVQPPITGK